MTTEFLSSLTNRVTHWTVQRLPNLQKFTISAQTNTALIRTSQCLSAQVEELFKEDYDFVLTVRLQSDALERRFGQNRQMIGVCFLVSVKDVKPSEKILKFISQINKGSL